MVSKTMMLIAGAILVAISIIGIVAFAEVPSKEYTYEDVTFDGPIFTPADGSEDFIFGNGMYKPVGTGIYEYLGTTVYGTLYVSDLNAWVVIDPTGQAIMSGSADSSHVMGV